MMPIASDGVIALLAQAEAFTRAGDTRAAIHRARLARRESKEGADLEACDLAIGRFSAADERRQEEVLARHVAHVAREIAALPDYQEPRAAAPDALAEHLPREPRRSRSASRRDTLNRRKETAMNRMIAVGAGLDALTKRWWIPVVRGVAAILFGVLALVAPSIGLLTLVMMWGVYAVTDGMMNLLLAIWAGRAGAKFGWYLFEAAVSLAAGVGTFLFPGITAMALLYLIAAWAVVTGIAEIVLAIALRHVVRRDWLLALAGGVSVVFGVLLFVFPGAGALTVLWMIGAYAIVFGVLLVGLGVKLQRLRRDARRELTFSGSPRTA